MFGVLVDVSGSMKKTYYAIDESSQRVNVERTHAIITSVMNIVNKEVVRHNRKDQIFVSAFGTQGPHCFPATCDLLELLTYFPDDYSSSDKEKLIRLARRKQAPHAEGWIRKYLDELEARFLHKVLESNSLLLDQLINLIPWQGTDYAAQKYAQVRYV